MRDSENRAIPLHAPVTRRWSLRGVLALIAALAAGIAAWFAARYLISIPRPVYGGPPPQQPPAPVYGGPPPRPK